MTLGEGTNYRKGISTVEGKSINCFANYQLLFYLLKLCSVSLVEKGKVKSYQIVTKKSVILVKNGYLRIFPKTSENKSESNLIRQ